MDESRNLLIVPEEPDGNTLRVPVLKVFDGDGFLTRITFPRHDAEMEVAVRFGFTDAPEMGQPGGQEAKDFLEGIIGGQWLDLAVLIKSDTGRIADRHGRMVAVPYLRQETSWVDRMMSGATGIPITKAPACRNIELEMVLNGWTWVLDRYGPDPRYFDALEDAQRNRRGIWARDTNVHPAEFKGKRYIEQSVNNAIGRESPMIVFDTNLLFGLSALLTAVSTLVWSLRRKT